MDAIVVFDDVFIPWERVFYLRSAQPANPAFEAQVFQGAVGLGPWYVLVRMAVKAEVLLGLCAAITDALGTASQPLVQMAMADAMVYLETLRALIQAAEANPVKSPSGLALPDPTRALAARICAIERYPHLLQSIRELSGSGLLMAPGQADLNDSESAPFSSAMWWAKIMKDPNTFAYSNWPGSMPATLSAPASCCSRCTTSAAWLPINSASRVPMIRAPSWHWPRNWRASQSPPIVREQV